MNGGDTSTRATGNCVSGDQAPVRFLRMTKSINFYVLIDDRYSLTQEIDNMLSFQTNKIVRAYDFLSEHFEYPHINFKLANDDDQLINFPILPEEELLSLTNEKQLSVKIVEEFLTLLDNKLTVFLKSELGVNKEYLFESLLHDMVETIFFFITETSKHLQSPFYDQKMLDFELSILRQRRDLEKFAIGLKETDRKDRIIRLCAERFQQLFYSEDEIVARTETLQLLGIADGNRILRQENIEILSRILIYIDNKELLKRMQTAFEREGVYHLKQKVPQMSQDLQKLLVSAEGLQESEPVISIVPTQELTEFVIEEPTPEIVVDVQPLTTVAVQDFRPTNNGLYDPISSLNDFLPFAFEFSSSSVHLSGESIVRE